MPNIFIFSLLTIFSTQVYAKDSFVHFMEKQRLECQGNLETIYPPVQHRINGRRYSFEGYRLVELFHDQDKLAAIGVLSAIKDASAETKNNIHSFLQWFDSHNVEAIIVNGDIALDEFDLEDILSFLAKHPKPIFVLPGNSESLGSFSRVTRNLYSQHPNIINLSWVRHIIADDYQIISVPGYHDRRFARVGSSCHYDKADLDKIRYSIKLDNKPAILVSHGPPYCSGKAKLDQISDGSHVGDKQLNELISALHIPFGIHGHILEAGGTITDKTFRKNLRPNTYNTSLFFNAGTANGLPWLLNSGKKITGMAAIFTINGSKAKVQFKQNQ